MRPLYALAVLTVFGLLTVSSHATDEMPQDAQARAAIDRYHTSVERAEQEYEEAVLRAQRVLLTQLEAAQRRAMTRGDLDDANRIQQQIDRLQDELDDPRRSATRGTLYVVLHGEGAIYLNGEEFASTQTVQTHALQIPGTLTSGDMLVFRIRSEFVHRTLRTAFVGHDGEPLTIALRMIDADDPTAVTPEMVQAGATPAGGPVLAGTKSAWDQFELPDQGAWIRPPAHGEWHTYAFVVP